jgi:hypothetical protein
MTVAAINIVRIFRWLAGEPKAATRPNALVLLYQPFTRVPDAEEPENRIKTRVNKIASRESEYGVMALE